jgi:hypothetical protein
MTRRRQSRKSRAVPKTVLRLPDLDQAKRAAQRTSKIRGIMATLTLGKSRKGNSPDRLDAGRALRPGAESAEIVGPASGDPARP